MKGNRSFGIPWSDKELAALEPYVQGRVSGRYRNSWHAARSFLADMEEEGTPNRRTPNAVHLRICRRLPSVAWEKSADWSRVELKIVDRHVRALVGTDRFVIGGEIDACAADLHRLHVCHPKAVWAQEDRSRAAVHEMLKVRARVLRRRWSGSNWTDAENRIVKRYARTLARGSYGGAWEAAKPCRDDLERLRRRNPDAVARRTLNQVAVQIVLRANRLGWSKLWAKPELRILDRFIRSYANGEFRTPRDTVTAIRRQLERLRKSGTRLGQSRTAYAVNAAIRTRAQALGVPLPHKSPIGEGASRLDWYSWQVVKGHIRTAPEAARRFMEEYEQHGSPDWSCIGGRWGYVNVLRAISKRAYKFGRRPTRIRWGTEEKAVLERYVGQLAAGQFASEAEAARSCVHDLDSLHRQQPTAQWALNERTLSAVKAKLEIRVKALGVRRAKRGFTADEQRILDRYARLLAKARIRKVGSAVNLCMAELERRHQRFLAQNPHLPRSPQPRTAMSVLDALSARSIRMGRPQRWLAWTEDQAEIAHKWAARCGHGTDRMSKAAAGRACAAELKRKGFQRDPPTCRAFIVKLVAGWRPGKPSGQSKGNPEVLQGQDGDSTLPTVRTAPDQVAIERKVEDGTGGRYPES